MVFNQQHVQRRFARTVVTMLHARLAAVILGHGVRGMGQGAAARAKEDDTWRAGRLAEEGEELISHQDRADGIGVQEGAESFSRWAGCA